MATQIRTYEVLALDVLDDLYFDDFDDLEDICDFDDLEELTDADLAESEAEESDEEGIEIMEEVEMTLKEKKLARQLSDNILKIWRFHNLISNMIGRGFPYDIVADEAVEEMLKYTGIILERFASTKIRNPIITFEECRKNGDYDSLTDEAYEKLKSNTAQFGKYWKNRPECDLQSLCLRMIGQK